MASCKYFKKGGPVSGEKVIARAGDEYLYLSDLSGLTKNLPQKDSATFISHYAESWVRRRLLLKKAEENVPAGDLGVDKKVEDYRQSLLLYEYEKGLINQKLDKGVNNAEINDFYEKNKDKFTLDNDIFDIQYVQIHAAAQDLDNMRQVILQPKNDDDLHKREGYCKAMAAAYSFADNNWMTSVAILKQFPLTTADLKGLPVAGKFVEYKSGNDCYFIFIKNVKHAGETSPLEYIRNQIKEVLLNKKKVVLIQKIYDGIYQDALKSGRCEVFAKSSGS